MLKLFTNTSRKENYRLILLKNVAANSLKEITENWIEWHIKKIILNKYSLSEEIKTDLT